MMHWTKEKALEELQNLTNEISSLFKVRRKSAEHVRWLARTLRVLEEVFGASSRYYLTLREMTWEETGSFAMQGIVDIGTAIERHHQKAYVNQLDMVRGILLAASDELIESTIEDVYEGKDTPLESSEIIKVLSLIEKKLRKVIHNIPKRERDVQDALENLLVGADVNYSRETDSIEYSSKTYIPDFSLTRIDLALEVKFSARAGREKEIIGEINDDILAYKTKYGNLLFVVYDTGFIRDVDRFISQFEQYEGVLVRVIKH